MKQLVVLAGCGILLMGLTGCQKANTGVKVVIEGGGEFPPFLAGRWKAADENHWEFVFEPDGTMSSVVDNIWRERLKANQTTEVRGRKGEPGFFEMGDCEVCYDPENREISAIITIKRVYLEIGGGILDGPCEYFIGGNIREDEKTWDADILTSLDLTVLLPDPNFVGEEPPLIHSGFLRTDANTELEHVIFTKVESIADKNE